MNLAVGYAFGASFAALFAQLGGGIYTKAADVGADLVGKVEAGIPEDDPRNPAVIADLVGDNVGDCAGRGADLFESTAAENIGAMILGVAIFGLTGNIGWVFFPLVVRAFGLLASLVGIMMVKLRNEDEEPMKALNRGYYVSAILGAIGFYVITRPTCSDAWQFFACGVIGIVLSIVIVYITQYYTAGEYRPVREIAKASETGPATNIITGFSIGLETTAPADHRHRRRSAGCLRPRSGCGQLIELASWDRPCERSVHLRSVRDRGRHHGHAGHRRVRAGHGHLRSDHRQRRRHRARCPTSRRRSAAGPTSWTRSATPPRP